MRLAPLALLLALVVYVPPANATTCTGGDVTQNVHSYGVLYEYRSPYTGKSDWWRESNLILGLQTPRVCDGVVVQPGDTLVVTGVPPLGGGGGGAGPICVPNIPNLPPILICVA